MTEHAFPEVRSLGYRLEDEDHDLLMATSTPLPFSAGDVEMPTLIDPREIIPIVNQGSMGSCVGNSGCSVLEWCNWLDGGEFHQLSRMWSYLSAQKASGFLGRDQGAAIVGCAQATESVGVCLESTFPYPASYSTRIPAGAAEEAADHKLKSHTPMKSYDDVVAFLKARLGGIQIGVNLVQSIDNNRDGLITELSGSSRGGHAMAWLELSPRLDSKGRNWIWWFNSWGRGWAKNGVAEGHPDVIDSICRRQTAYGYSKLQILEPQLINWGKS